VIKNQAEAWVLLWFRFLSLFSLEVTMKLIKSLLLGSVAALAAVTGAQAADLPSKKAAPVEYVRVCSAYGAGFFYIPGTDTCLRVGGRVRAEYRYSEPFARSADSAGFRARGRLNVDARTQTAYGTLRAFMRYELTADTGSYGTAGSSVNLTKSNLEKAFIQFAGITAGRAQSFFDFYANDLNFQDLRGSDNLNQNLLAYTASFGSGFSATISLEDATQRRTSTGAFANAINYAGERMPDVVGVLRVDQGWGSAQLSAAVHQIQALNFGPAIGGVQTLVDTEYGFAIQGGLKFNLPAIAAGDVLWLQGAYADGALAYLTAQNTSLIGATTRGHITTNNADAFIDAVGNAKKTKGYALVAGFTHYWTPTVRQSIYGSYLRLDYAAAISSPIGVNGAVANGAVVDQSEWRLGSNVIWSPGKRSRYRRGSSLRSSGSKRPHHNKCELQPCSDENRQLGWSLGRSSAHSA
jgi:hypothetical protein